MDDVNRSGDWTVPSTMPSTSGPLPAASSRLPSAELPWAVVNSAPGGIWAVDLEGRTIFSNAEMARLLGYRPEELARLSLFDVLDDEGREQLVEVLERERRCGGGSEQVECLFLRRDSVPIWCMVNRSELRDPAGRHLGSVNLVTDITDRLAVADELRLSEARLAEAQRVSHLGSWEWDIDSGAVSWSDEMYRIFGYTAREVEPTYQAFLDRVHPDDRQRMAATIATCLHGEPGFTADCRFCLRSGEVVWGRSVGEVVLGDDGRPRLLRGTTLDITAGKTAEEELRRTSARYRLLQAMATTANRTSSFQEVLHLAVPEISAHTGWSLGRAHLVSEDHRRLVLTSPWHARSPRHQQALDELPSDQRAAVAALVQQVLDERRPLSLVLDPPPAELGLRAAFAFPVLARGEVVAVFTFLSESAAEVHAELDDVWEEAGAQLARVHERELAAREVAAARDTAMRSSRMKSEFLANMSHEIRTPMNAVIGLTGLLLQTTLDETQRQYAQGVHGAGEALLAVINDILDFSKLEADKVELESADLDVPSLVDEVGLLLAPEAYAKGLELVAYCYPDVPARLRGDPGRIRQILLNLASNAVKFTPAGEVGITVRRRGGDTGPVRLLFEVRDTGIGIAPDNRERLFDSFSQADASTTRRYGGTGLGLAICQRLVDAMGGSIGFESELGTGSTFWFELPLDRDSSTPDPSRVAPAPSLAGLRALVVDDNATNRMILQCQLAAWSVQTELAGDAAAALRLLRSAAAAGTPYEVVILDLCMPDTDGLALARAVTEDPALAGTPMMMLTSTRAVDPEELHRAGVAQWLTKPVRSRELYQRLGLLLAPGASPPPEVPSATPAGAPRRRASTSRGRVLVVEDNALNQMVAEGVVSSLGYSVDIVSNGVEALRALDGVAYRAVLMDCHMPVMDGYRATEEIRRRERSPVRTPIIAMTASAMTEDRDRCLAAGMDDYVSKPVTTEAVELALGRWAGSEPVAEHQDSTTRPAVGTPDDPPLDAERLEALRRLQALADPRLVHRLVELYARDSAASLAAVTDAGHDREALQAALHKLVGTSANVGAQRVVHLCRRLEEAVAAGSGCRDGDLRQLAAELAAANAALEHLVQAPA